MRNRTGDKRGRYVGSFVYTSLAFSIVSSPSGPDVAACDAGQHAGVVYRRGGARSGARSCSGGLLGLCATPSDVALFCAFFWVGRGAVLPWPPPGLGGGRFPWLFAP